LSNETNIDLSRPKFNATTGTNTYSEIFDLYNGNDQKLDKQCEIEFEPIPMSQLINDYENFELREKIFSKSNCHSLLIYSSLMIVNKTRVDLVFGADKNKKTIEKQTTEFFAND
jgi:hypothetical protein